MRIYLPRHDAGAEQVLAPKTAVRAGPAAGETILVVEDEEAVRTLTVDMLTELGYRVLAADGAAKAMRMLDAHPEVALLFTDVIMPETNGRKLAEQALRLRPALKILFTTGYSRNALVQGEVLDPGVELIGKPFTMADLETRVRTILDAA